MGAVGPLLSGLPAVEEGANGVLVAPALRRGGQQVKEIPAQKGQAEGPVDVLLFGVELLQGRLIWIGGWCSGWCGSQVASGVPADLVLIDPWVQTQSSPMQLPFPLPLPMRKECGGLPCGGAGAIGYPDRSGELLRK
jgi:hypothetical protein